MKRYLGIVFSATLLVSAWGCGTMSKRQEGTETLTIQIGSNEVKSVSVTLGQTPMEVVLSLRPAEIMSDDDPMCGCRASDGGMYILYFLPGNPKKPQDDRLAAIAKFGRETPGDNSPQNRKSGVFLLPADKRGEQCPMKYPEVKAILEKTDVEWLLKKEKDEPVSTHGTSTERDLDTNKETIKPDNNKSDEGDRLRKDIEETRLKLDRETKEYERQLEALYTRNPLVKQYDEATKSAFEASQSAEKAMGRLRRESSNSRTFNRHYDAIKEIQIKLIFLDRITSPDAKELMRKYFVDAPTSLKSMAGHSTILDLVLVNDRWMKLLIEALPPVEAEKLRKDPKLFWQTQINLTPDVQEQLRKELEDAKRVAGFSQECVLNARAVAETQFDWDMYYGLAISSRPRELIDLDCNIIEAKHKIDALERRLGAQNKPASSPHDGVLRVVDREVMKEGVCILRGTVVDRERDISEEQLAKLEQATSNVEATNILFGCKTASPVVPEAIVTLQGDSFRKEVVSDSQGNFEFVGLSCGDFDVSAKVAMQPSWVKEKRMAIGRMRIRLPQSSSQRVSLEIHEHAVTVKGRITAADGQPVVGAKVIGTPGPYLNELGEPTDETKRFEREFRNSIVAVSDADGFYELQGFEPPEIYAIAYYIRDDLHNLPSNGTYVAIHVEADGLVQTEVPQVPLVTEELLVPARRLSRLLIRNSAQPSPKKEKLPDFREKRVKFPLSHGNTMTDVDIKLDPVNADTRQK